MPPPPPTQWFPGLSQTGKLGAGAREVYRHALQHILLPRLIVRLEGQMRTRIQQPAFLYEATQGLSDARFRRARWIAAWSRNG